MNNSYCVLPWVSITVDPDGSIKPCCVSQDFIKKPTGEKFNLGFDKIEDIVNSKDLVEIRQKMLAGEKVAGCSQCYQHEEYGGKSQRLQYNQMFPLKFSQSHVERTDIKYFDLRLGNLCNLNCRSCSPKNSSQFSKEINELHNTNITKFHEILPLTIDTWYESDVFMDNIDSQLKNIKLLYLTGGEPTIIKKNFEILNKLISTGFSKNITVMINSNMTNLNSDFYEILDEFKSVIFFASIDGTGPIQEYLRYPSDWNQIDNNITKLIKRANIKIHPTPVIQTTNLNKIVDLFEYFENFNISANKSIVEMMPIVLENPKYLDLLYLPLDYKLMCWERIEKFIKNCKFQSPLFFNKMKALKNKCLLDSVDLEYLNLYKEYNTILDINRNQKLSDINPELYTIL
jgi:MoaA/NifB/PqqE/SkfB family radical SAM enzyme